MAITWQEVTVPAVGSGDDLRDFCAVGADGFCAVGDNGLVYTSPDGLTWTKRTAAAANNWRGVAFNGSRLAAVSSGGASRVMTSDNLGVTWTSRSASEANGWQSVTWADGLGLFVAVANSGTHRVMTSADGITWANQTAAAARLYVGVCWSVDLSLLCAVSSDADIMTSTNSILWTAQTSIAGAIQSGAASGSSVVQWSSVAGVFAFGVQSVGRHVETSPDAVTWTEQTIPDALVANGGLVDTVDGLLLFRKVGTNDRVNTSADGTVWTAVNPGFNRTWDCAGWSADLGVVVSWDNASTDTILVGTFPAVPPTPPSVSSVTPASGPVAGGTVVTFTGSGFNATTGVTFDGLAATFTIVSDTTLTAISPAHAAGAVTVAIAGPGVTATFTYTLTRVLLPPVPRLH